MIDALKLAASIGISIQDFWYMTAAELFIYVNVFNNNEKQKQENLIVLEYMNAAWHRTKKMPSLHEVLNQQGHKEQTPEEMLEVVKQLNAMYGGTTKGG